MSKTGLKDIAESLRRPNLWLRLGIRDLLLDHARAALGVFWPMLGALTWISVIYFIMGVSLSQNNADYLAYITIGVVTYNFASGVLVNGVRSFVRFKGVILNIPNPLFVYPLRMTVKVSFGVSLQIIFIVLALWYCNIPAQMVMLWVIPSIFALLITGVFVALIMGMIGVRIGDLQFMMTTIMRLMMFSTPIFWYPAETGLRMIASKYNPLAHYIEVIRGPLMGRLPDMLSVQVVAANTLFVIFLGLFMFVNGRNDIVRRL